jgi:phosphotransacetylase
MPGANVNPPNSPAPGLATPPGIEAGEILYKSLAAFSPANAVAAFVAFPGIGASVNIPSVTSRY